MLWPSCVILRLVAFGCLWLFARNASVTFSVRTGLDGFVEAYDNEAAVRGLASPHTFLAATTGILFGVCVLPGTYCSGLCFRIVRLLGFDSGYSSCVSLRWLLVAFLHTSV